MSTFIGAKCNIKALVGGFSIIHLASSSFRENLSDHRSLMFTFIKTRCSLQSSFWPYFIVVHTLLISCQAAQLARWLKVSWVAPDKSNKQYCSNSTTDLGLFVKELRVELELCGQHLILPLWLLDNLLTFHKVRKEARLTKKLDVARLAYFIYTD